MAITIEQINIPSTSAAAQNPDGSYPDHVVINFGRPGIEHVSIQMRALVYWAAHRIEDNNHRTASLLRAIAEQFYPASHDDSDWIREDIEDHGAKVDFDFNEMPPPAVDVRLLGLADGFAHFSDTFDEALWDNQAPTPVLARNASSFLNFTFPAAAANPYGIIGIRVRCLDLIHWLQSSVVLREMAYQDEDAWLDAWEQAGDRHLVNERRRSDTRLCARHGDQAIDDGRRPLHPGTTDPVEQDAILAEISALI